jgi:hypothetical protein
MEEGSLAGNSETTNHEKHEIGFQPLAARDLKRYISGIKPT